MPSTCRGGLLFKMDGVLVAVFKGSKGSHGTYILFWYHLDELDEHPGP